MKGGDENKPTFLILFIYFAVILKSKRGVKMRKYLSLLLSLILLSILSCSQNAKINGDKINPVIPNSEPITTAKNALPDQNCNRQLAGITNSPAYRFWFSPEDLLCNNSAETVLVDDIAACHIVTDTTPSIVDNNYVLVIDSKQRPCSNSTNRVRIYSMEENADASGDAIGQVSWGSFSSYSFTDNSIADPDGCDLIPGNSTSKMYSVIADDVFVAGVGPCVKVFEHTLNENGSVSSTITRVMTIENDNLTGVGGVAGVLFSSGSYKVFVCQRGPKNVLVFDGNETLVATLDDFGTNTPTDVCVAYNSDSSGYIYVAVVDTSDRNNDYIRVYRGYNSGGSYWNTYEDRGPAELNGVDQTFGWIAGVAVHEYNDHNGHTVAALQLDSADGWGFTLKQMNFGDTDGTCEDYTQNFSISPTDNDQMPSISEGIAIGIADRGAVYDEGYFYLMGDRDPDINTNNRPTGAGDNCVAFSNSQ